MSVPQAKAVSYLSVPVAAATNIGAGVPLCFNTSGQACIPADTTGIVYAGTSLQDVDNSAGAAAAKNVPICPVFEGNRYLTLTLTGVVQADVGEEAYWTGATTVTKSAGNGVKAGMIAAVLATDTALIDTLRHVA